MLFLRRGKRRCAKSSGTGLDWRKTCIYRHARIKQLSGTSVPKNFQVCFTLECDDPVRIENAIHGFIKEIGYKHIGKEFYNIGIEQLYSLFKTIAFMIDGKVQEYMISQNHKPMFKKEGPFDYIRALPCAPTSYTFKLAAESDNLPRGYIGGNR